MIKNLPYLLVLVLLLFSCSKNDLVELDGVEKIFLKNCVNFNQDEYLIDSREKLTEVFKDINTTTYCADFEMPDIDFEAETLLGIKSQTPIRNSHLVNREVLLDTEDDKYIYIVYQSEQLKDLETQVNWVIVPILPEGYEVEFRLR